MTQFGCLSVALHHQRGNLISPQSNTVAQVDSVASATTTAYSLKRKKTMTNPEIIVALHKALNNTLDTLLDQYFNGDNCPSCGGEYNENEEESENWLLWCKHDENCTLDEAVALRNKLNEEAIDLR